MAEKIKKFFQKKKVEAKFKMAGPGRKLTDDSSSRSLPVADPAPVASRGPMSDEARQAAAAAMARLNVGKRPDQAAFQTSLAAIQSQVRREMEAEKKAATLAAESSQQSIKSPTPVELEASPLLAVQGVYFRCPLISDEILSKDEWQAKIRDFLFENLESEKGLTACLIIHSCNKGREKISNCVTTLQKYMDNIIRNPDDEKYRRIKLNNRVFQEKVAPLEGTSEFLEAAGFEKKTIPVNDTEETFYVFSEVTPETLENLQMLYDALGSAEPVQLELDRNLNVLYPSQAAKRVELPPVFFNITAEELKREQQLRSEGIERSMMLRTKAMREKEELREMRKYRFALIRVRFPDGILLQGTFGVHEKVENVISFVRENLEDESLNFCLTTPTGHKLTSEDEQSSLVDLRLVPATILTFSVDSEGPLDRNKMYLKGEVMILVQPIS
ncbi:UBX domain-containing protein 6 [Frankliniella fusca]|uniref:UBX domain-containing protein 6 n=1 Tax=Frankliniella fusca TaxID=407009 RepID=A0AAE1LDD5_9NEOP|nr:UBX domain-containing protein 6 [Frankliniella fusca]